MKKENNGDFAPDEIQVGYTVLMYGKIKNFNGTYELDGTKNGGAYVVSVIAEVVEVESVSLSQDEIAMQVDDLVTLEAYVHPNEANQKVNWTVEQEGDIISFNQETGVITGLAVGSAVITATSVENAEAHASATVTVSEKTKILSDIEVDTSNVKVAYNVGESYSYEGIVVTAKYSNAEDQIVTAAATVTMDKSVASDQDEQLTLTVSYGGIVKQVVLAIQVSAKSSLQIAYETAIALQSGETAEMTFEGTIVAKRANNEWFIQDGAYGIEYYAANTDFEVGKRVQVVSTLQKYNGLPETKTIKSGTVLGVGTLPTPVTITSVAEQSATNFNVLANVVGTAKEDWSSYSATSNKTLKISTTDGDIDVFLKSGLFSSLEAKIQAVKAGDTVTFTNVVTSIFTNPQICFCVGSDLTVEAAPVKTIVDIVSATGPSGAVDLNYEFKTSDVTVVVEYDDHSTGNGKVTAINAPTNAAGDNLKGTVTVEGWDDPVEFTYSVVGSVAYVNATMAAGTNGSACKVNNLDGIKVGTSKNDGNMTITVPSGATRVKLYAVAWKDAPGTISVSISSGTASVESLTLLADDGLSNNSPFTLVGNLETFVHTFTLSGVSAEATITLSSGTARRFAVWGAQYAL
jgi:hypothetical protein